MSTYERDDGAEMVEYKPGRTVPREIGIRLGLISPEIGFGKRCIPAPAADPQSEPVIPPPLQPSLDDLVSVAPETAIEVAVPVAAVPSRAPRSRPPKRSIAEILAEADRGFRALRAKS